MDALELKNILQNAGVAGAGGAGFPSYAKLSEKADTVILNCAECEPLLKLHRQVLQQEAEKIIEALSVICSSIGAKEFVVALKGSYKEALNAVNEAIKDYPMGRVHILKEVYPSGDEVVLVYDVTGKVVPAGGIPIDIGCIVYNVETVFNIYNAIFEGKKVTHKYVTVAGEVKEPKTLYAPLGTPFSHLIAMCGGTTVEECALIQGGPMTGKLTHESHCVTKTTNAILVLPKDHYLINKRKEKATISVKRAMSVCCQCKVCTDLCPRNILGHPIDPAGFMRCISSTKAEIKPLINTLYCVGCGLCELYSCPQGLSPAALIGIYKSKLRKNGIKVEKITSLPPVCGDRNYRTVPMKRLMARLDVTKYNLNAPLVDDEVKPHTLKISTGQHIGAPSVPIVKKGDRVSYGDVIALAAQNALSLPLHSPLSGIVEKVNEREIIIKQ